MRESYPQDPRYGGLQQSLKTVQQLRGCWGHSELPDHPARSRRGLLDGSTPDVVRLALTAKVKDSEMSLGFGFLTIDWLSPLKRHGSNGP